MAASFDGSVLTQSRFKERSWLRQLHVNVISRLSLNSLPTNRAGNQYWKAVWKISSTSSDKSCCSWCAHVCAVCRDTTSWWRGRGWRIITLRREQVQGRDTSSSWEFANVMSQRWQMTFWCFYCPYIYWKYPIYRNHLAVENNNKNTIHHLFFAKEWD